MNLTFLESRIANLEKEIKIWRILSLFIICLILIAASTVKDAKKEIKVVSEDGKKSAIFKAEGFSFYINGKEVVKLLNDSGETGETGPFIQFSYLDVNGHSKLGPFGMRIKNDYHNLVNKKINQSYLSMNSSEFRMQNTEGARISIRPVSLHMKNSKNKQNASLTVESNTMLRLEDSDSGKFKVVSP